MRSSTYMYYTDNVFPTGTVSGTSTSPLAYAYFDDYNMTGGGSPTFSYVQQKDVSLPNEESATTAKVKGMPTVVTKTTVGSGLSSTWLTSVIFYDHNLHVIQKQSNNQLNYTGATTVTDFKTVVNDFTGMPLYSKVTKKRTSADTVSVYTAITYDQAYRVTGISQKYNSGPNNPVAAYNYNELGQPILKNLGYINPGSWLQNEDFRYNIRGWLMSINNSKLTPDGGKTNSDSNDLFGMQLMYDKADSSGNLINTVKYDGRPTGIKWMTRNYSNTRTRERSFLYYYNGFGHYSGESYAERDSTSTGTSPYNINRGAFNETSLTYDLNGNLVTLSRNSSNAAGGFYQVDTLKYTYNSSNQNQLIKVTDGTDSVHVNHGFRSIDSTANYEYDANGNLYNDHFKGMQLRYNVLNRTDKINITTASGQSIDYTYDADGNLLRKRAYSGGTLQTTTDYIDGFVYLTIGVGTPALSYFPMPEGRVVNVSGTLTQEFILTDQQGNARVAFRNVGGKAKVFQENSYYGTGLLLPNSPVGTPAIANKKLYNGGSEWQNDSAVGSTNPYNLPDYYETYNRNYDATIGRFIGVDPMAESAEHLSSYQYAGCNPIVMNDPDGDLSQAQWAFFANQYKNGVNGNYTASSDGTDNVYTTDSNGNIIGPVDPNNVGGGGGTGGNMGGAGGTSGDSTSGTVTSPTGSGPIPTVAPGIMLPDVTVTATPLSKPGSFDFNGINTLPEVTVTGQAFANWGGQDYENINHLLPNSIQWQALGPGTAEGVYHYANLKRHIFIFNTWENGKVVNSFIANIPMMSFGIPSDDFKNNVDLEIRFSDAWDATMSIIDDYFQLGDKRLANPQYFEQQFEFILKGQLQNVFNDPANIHIWIDAPQEVPISLPKYTDQQNH